MRAPLAAFLALGVAYALAVPMFEKPDETRHLDYVRFLARERRLPRPLPDAPYHEETHWQGAHGPLPHAVAAVVLLGLDPAGRGGIASDPALWVARPVPDTHAPDAPGRWPRLNPRAFRPADPELNWFERDPRDRPPRRYPFTTLVGLRLAALAWGLGTVWLTHAAAVLALGPGRWAACATWLVALHPQHAFMASAIGNDGAAACLGALVAWLGLRHVRGGTRGRPGARALLLGAALGAGMLARIAVAGTGVFAAACAVVAARRRRRTFPLLALGAGVLLVSGWWFARNAALTGDPLGWRGFLAASADRLRPQPWWSEYFWTGCARCLLPMTFTSFWGRFGWLSVTVPPTVYAALAVLSAAGVAGLVRAWWRRRAGLPLALLGMHAAATVALLLWFNLVTPQPQGRYLFPSLAPLMILLAAGLRELAGRARWPAWAAPGVLAAANAVAFLVFGGVYR